MWQPSATELKPVRQRILDDPDAFQLVLDALDDADMAFDDARKVKTMPRGFGDHDEDPNAAIIRLQQLTALRPLSKQSFIDDSAAGAALEAVGALKVFYDFIDDATK